jgi:hypothetical protein
MIVSFSTFPRSKRQNTILIELNNSNCNLVIVKKIIGIYAKNEKPPTTYALSLSIYIYKYIHTYTHKQ